MVRVTTPAVKTRKIFVLTRAPLNGWNTYVRVYEWLPVAFPAALYSGDVPDVLRFESRTTREFRCTSFFCALCRGSIFTKGRNGTDTCLRASHRA